VKTRLERWLLVKLILVVVLLAFMVLVNIDQARTIQAQKAELVAQIKTLIASQQYEVQMIHQMDDEEKKFEEAIKTCKSK